MYMYLKIIGGFQRSTQSDFDQAVQHAIRTVIIWNLYVEIGYNR